MYLIAEVTVKCSHMVQRSFLRCPTQTLTLLKGSGGAIASSARLWWTVKVKTHKKRQFLNYLNAKILKAKISELVKEELLKLLEAQSQSLIWFLPSYLFKLKELQSLHHTSFARWSSKSDCSYMQNLLFQYTRRGLGWASRRTNPSFVKQIFQEKEMSKVLW